MKMTQLQLLSLTLETSEDDLTPAVLITFETSEDDSFIHLPLRRVKMTRLQLLSLTFETSEDDPTPAALTVVGINSPNINKNWANNLFNQSLSLYFSYFSSFYFPYLYLSVGLSVRHNLIKEP